MMSIPERLRVCADAIQRAYAMPTTRARAQLLLESRGELYAILNDLRMQLTKMTISVPRPPAKPSRPKWFDLVPDKVLVRYWAEFPDVTVTLARTLAKLGIQSLEHLSEVSEASLLSTPFIGLDSIRRIRKTLSDANMSLQGTGTQPLEPATAVELHFHRQAAAGGAQ